MEDVLLGEPSNSAFLFNHSNGSFLPLEVSFNDFQDDPPRIPEIHDLCKSQILRGTVKPYPVGQELLVNLLNVFCFETNMSAP